MNPIFKDDIYDFFEIFSSEKSIIAASSTKECVFSERDSRAEFVNRLCGNQPAAIPVQLHSANVKWVEAGAIFDECDGLLTKETNLALTLRTADCVALFLYFPNIQTIGLIHIGWRGYQRGILRKSAEILREAGANFSQGIAALGPSICGECYEIQSDVAELFPGKTSSRDGKIFLDLPNIIEKELIKLGLEKIERSQSCTYHDRHRYYSYRRDKTDKRMISVMMRKK